MSSSTKFTTMLHKRTNKITRVLQYVVLEWTLIFLLLLNSLYSYFILKFALYFGLKPPCLFCSRLDHVFDTQNTNKNTFSSCTKFICDEHASEISKVSYCSHHKKLVESRNLCSSCSLQQHDAPLIKWMKEIGIVENGDDTARKCSCCDVVMIKPTKFSSSSNPYFDFMANLITENEFNGCFLDQEQGDIDKSDSGYELLDDNEDENEDEVVLKPLLSMNDEEEDEDDDDNIAVGSMSLCYDNLPQHLEFYIDHDDYRLIPVETVGESVKNESKSEKSESLEEFSKEVDLVFEGDEIMGFCEVNGKNLPSIKEEEEEDEVTEKAVVVEKQMEEHSQVVEVLQEVDEVKREVKNLIVFEEEEEDSFCVFESEFILQGMVENSHEFYAAENGVYSDSAVCKEDMESDLRRDEASTEKNVNLTQEVLIEVDEPITTCKDDSPTIIDNEVCEASTSLIHLPSSDENDAEAEETSVEISERNLMVNVGLSNIEIEEEKIPDTPNSVENLNLHKKLLFLGRQGSITEESLDGSIMSEHEVGDGATLIDKLKSELQNERKTLRALYVELEEERNASAIAANHTMAMINRLQEEKATMQMEASQYQRMMEEQAEYDQEALQMMNELMVKREKEKQELEKEVEVYRKRLLDFEEREKARILCRRMEGSLRSRNSSASVSYGEESDGLSIDLNHEVKDQEEGNGISPLYREENGDQDTPTDEVLNLQDSLGGFEDERQSILEQLKVLEEKLFTLAEEEEEEENTDNMRQFDELYDENGKDIDYDEANGGENGLTHMNGTHDQERWINGSMQKRLLPLFDEVESLDSPNGMSHSNRDGFEMVLNKSSISKFELEKKRLAIEEEVYYVYERLHALEADREFLKHCIGSLRKGDKGLDLLQEILQHLRDLKNVELQVVKNMDPCASV